MDHTKKSKLGSIFDAFNTLSISGISGLIDQYKAELSSKIGLFLQNDLRLRTANFGMDSVKDSSDVTIKSASGAILQQLAALRVNQDALMGTSSALVTKLINYKTYIEGTSPLKELITGNMSLAMITTEQVAIVTKAIADGISLTDEATKTIGSLDAQNAAVDKITAQVAAIIAATKGAGTIPTMDEILVPLESFVESTAKAVSASSPVLYGILAVGTVLGTVYLFRTLRKRKTA